jgi:CheY-like chemotaxis protein
MAEGSPNIRAGSILLADDDPDDQLLVQEALNEAHWSGGFDTVRDGEELLVLLEHAASARNGKRLPDLILLDLNMPRVDGREALRRIRQDPRMRKVRIVVLTTSNSPEDIRQTYELGADSYVIKPTAYHGLVEMIRDLTRYWFSTVQLPSSR